MQSINNVIEKSVCIVICEKKKKDNTLNMKQKISNGVNKLKDSITHQRPDHFPDVLN